jgi:hypothetical protein
LWAEQLGQNAERIIPGQILRIYFDIGLDREVTIEELLKYIRSEEIKIFLWVWIPFEINILLDKDKVQVVDIYGSAREKLWSRPSVKGKPKYPSDIKASAFRLEAQFLLKKNVIETVIFSFALYLEQKGRKEWATDPGEYGVVIFSSLLEPSEEELKEWLNKLYENYLSETADN